MDTGTLSSDKSKYINGKPWFNKCNEFFYSNVLKKSNLKQYHKQEK